MPSRRSSPLRLVIPFALAFLALALLATAAQARKAYVANYQADTVSVIDSASSTAVAPPIAVGDGPLRIAISPDGSRAYVANLNSETVSVIDTATDSLVGPPILVGAYPRGIAISPDGSLAYVTTGGLDSVAVIDLRTNTLVGPPIAVGDFPDAIAISPDGSRAYVANRSGSSLSVLDTAIKAQLGPPIAVDGFPSGIAITPDGSRVYATNGEFDAKDVFVLDTRTNSLASPLITAGLSPTAIAIAPDGSRAYVGNSESDDVSLLDLTTNAPIGAPIGIAAVEGGIAFSPDGARAYVSREDDDDVIAIDTRTNAAVGPPVAVGDRPVGIAIVPNQPPRARLGASLSGPVATLSAAGSVDPDGRIAEYSWDFGDGTGASGQSPSVNHTYAPGGAYTATLTVSDEEGCSTRFVFTGQTASCNGSAAARARTQVGPIPAAKGAEMQSGKPPPGKPRFGKLRRDRRLGTAKLAVTLPSAGLLTVSGKKAVKRSLEVDAAGGVKVLIKAKGKARRKLDRTGTAMLQLRVAFAPVGGAVSTQIRQVKLIQLLEAKGGKS